MPHDDTVYLTSDEFTALIKEATRDHTLDCGFGGGRIWLKRRPDGRIASAWALPFLAVMRGVKETESVPA
jgi:hypothetical protein